MWAGGQWERSRHTHTLERGLAVEARGITSCPGAGHAVVLLAIVQILIGDAGHQGVSRVAVGQHGADGQQHLGDGQRGAPVLLEDVQADGALAVDVAVVDARLEHHLGTDTVKGKLAGTAQSQCIHCSFGCNANSACPVHVFHSSYVLRFTTL